MENQHKKITGYRDLTQGEIDMINMVEGEGFKIEEIITLLSETPALDQKWVAIAETHLQQGIMALVRSVAKPDSF